MSSPPVTVRRAELRDYDAVLDINRNVYYGFDYVPALYFTYFHDNNHVIYVLEQDGQLISLVIYELNAVRTHVTTMAIRVRPSHQGRGFSVDKSAELKSMLHKEFPQVTHEFYATDKKQETEKKIAKSTMLFQWKEEGYQTTIADIRQHLQVSKENSIERASPYSLIELSYSSSIELLSNTSIIQSFLGQYTTEYIPVSAKIRLVRVNQQQELKSVFAEARVFVSKKQHQQGCDVIDESDKIYAMSFCHIIPADIGCRLDVYYYGDITEFCAHMTAQLLHAATVWDQNIGVFFNFMPSLEFDEVNEILSGFGLTKEKFEIIFGHMHMVLGVKKINF